jgi:hypothetical protein
MKEIPIQRKRNTMPARKRLIVAVLVFITVLTISPTAKADSFKFTGSGTWDAGTPTTAYSAAGATWQFSFFLPGILSSNPTTQVTDFSYALNGTVVTTSLPGGVLFYSVADGGGFDLYPTMNNTSDVGVISLIFPDDVGSNLTVVGGTFKATIELNDGITTANGLAPGSGSGTVSISSVPEPPGLWMIGPVLLLGAARLLREKMLGCV